ncbi:MAG: accessory gene regulator ArgB-like protein [Syntrophomonadaceae bacterium]|jgi:accessory gene regulator B
MQLLARKLSRFLAENANNSSYHEDEIRYGIEIFAGALLQILIILAIALLLGIGREVMAIMVSSVVYRRYTDGPHCQSYYRCTIVSIVNLILLGYISQYIPANFLPFYLIGLAIFSVLIIHYYVPANNHINPITDELIRKKRRQKSYGTVFFFLLFTICISYIGGEKLVPIGLLLGLFWQNILLLPGGQSYINLWDQFFDKVEKLLKAKEVLKC